MSSHRIHVVGWNLHLLRWRLGVLLAAIDDLGSPDDLTTDLVCYHHDRRVAAGAEEIEAWSVLADVETTLRAAVPLPHPAPHVTDLDTMQQLLIAAEEEYLRLIGVHLDHAEQVLAMLTAPGHDHTT